MLLVRVAVSEMQENEKKKNKYISVINIVSSDHDVIFIQFVSICCLIVMEHIKPSLLLHKKIMQIITLIKYLQPTHKIVVNWI